MENDSHGPYNKPNHKDEDHWDPRHLAAILSPLHLPHTGAQLHAHNYNL